MGEWKRGKSTFLNVLLGQEVLPTDVLSSILIPIVIKYGQHDDQVKVYYNNGTKTELMTVEEFEEKYSFQPDSDFTREQTGISVLECPSPLLANGIEFIDTPGLNYSGEQNRIIDDYITMPPNAIIFLLSAQELLTRCEAEYINKLHFQHNIQNIFLLINRWDLVLKEYEKEKICDHFTRRLSDYLSITEKEVEKMWGKRIFTISALAALNKLNKHETLERTGFPEFINSFANFLENLENIY